MTEALRDLAYANEAMFYLIWFGRILALWSGIQVVYLLMYHPQQQSLFKQIKGIICMIAFFSLAIFG